MAHNVVRTEIPEHLQPLPKLTFCTWRKYRPEYKTADPLLDQAGKIVDALPMPQCWSWSPDQVADWFQTELNYLEYKDAFIRNLICGRTLILLEADELPRVSIKNFFHNKIVTAAIRDLYKVDQDEFHRSISLPMRRPETMYLWYRTKTGPVHDNTTRTQFFRLINIIREETIEERRYYALLNHWNRIPPYRPWCPHVLIGGIRRINPMTGTTQRTNPKPKDHPYLLKNLSIWYLECENDKLVASDLSVDGQDLESAKSTEGEAVPCLPHSAVLPSTVSTLLENIARDRMWSYRQNY